MNLFRTLSRAQAYWLKTIAETAVVGMHINSVHHKDRQALLLRGLIRADEEGMVQLAGRAVHAFRLTKPCVDRSGWKRFSPLERSLFGPDGLLIGEESRREFPRSRTRAAREEPAPRARRLPDRRKLRRLAAAVDTAYRLGGRVPALRVYQAASRRGARMPCPLCAQLAPLEEGLEYVDCDLCQAPGWQRPGWLFHNA